MLAHSQIPEVLEVAVYTFLNSVNELRCLQIRLKCCDSTRIETLLQAVGALQVALFIAYTFTSALETRSYIARMHKERSTAADCYHMLNHDIHLPHRRPCWSIRRVIPYANRPSDASRTSPPVIQNKS